MVQGARETEKQAAQWLARRDSDHWSPHDQRELDEWLSQSTGNLVAFLRLESAWNRADRLQALGAGVPPGKIPSSEDFRRLPLFAGDSPGQSAARDSEGLEAQGSSNRRFRRALAASLAVAVVGAGAWFSRSKAPDYHTPIGGTASVSMTDGSSVILNTDSAIRVHLTAKEREITLDQGEAFFEVAHDSGRPFVVHASNKRVIAVGTKFSVRRLGDDVRVYVIEGTVGLEAGESNAAPSRNEANDTMASRHVVTGKEVNERMTGEIFLAAGGVARTDGDGVLVQERTPAEVEESLSWRTGYVIFHENTLADAVGEFNRYTSRRIVIEDPDIAGIKLSGKFRTTDVEAFVRLITGGFPIGVRQTSDRVILIKK